MSIYGSKRLPLTPLLLLMAPKVYFWLPMSTYGFICLLMAPYVYLWLLMTSSHSAPSAFLLLPIAIMFG